MLGLNDEYLAHRPASFFNPGHNKYDADYVLSKQPDLIAAWIDSENLDLAWGLAHTKYEESGYRLKFLVSVERDLEPANILDVSTMDKESIVNMLFEGFYYGVLERRQGPGAPGSHLTQGD